MPIIFLSVPEQSGTRNDTGSTGFGYSSRIANAIEPYLRANGIRFIRSSPGISLGQAIRESNAGYYDLNFTLYFERNKESETTFNYNPYVPAARQAAETFAENYKKTASLPDTVKAVPTNHLPEAVKTNTTTVAAKLDDILLSDEWFGLNAKAIAANLTESITRFFDLPFVSKPGIVLQGTVYTDSADLDIHLRPTPDSEVIAQARKDSSVSILGVLPGWYVVDYRGDIGYVPARYVTL